MEMKNSGYGYLSYIPKNWRVNRLKYHFMRSGIKNHSECEVLSLYRELGIVPKDSRDDNHNVTSEDTSKYLYVKSGDFVVNKMKAWQGSLAVSEYTGIVSPAYFVYSFKNNNTLDGRYFHYLIRNKQYTIEFRRLSGGIREGQWDLPAYELENVRILIPSIEEQKRIAFFLDEKCAEIDNLISDIREQIEILKQYKKSLILETVTKGLNPDIELKDSGIEWIGDIPKHWKIAKVKYLCEMRSGENLTANDISDHEDGLNCYQVFGANGFRGYYNDYSNDGIFCVIGRQGALAGNVHIAKGKFWATDHAVVVYQYSSVDVSYLYYNLVAMNLNQYAYDTAAQPGLAVSKILNLSTIIIPLNEQQLIVKYLNDKCEKIDDVIKLKEKQVEVIIKYKNSLIYEYVTGKKKVISEIY